MKGIGVLVLTGLFSGSLCAQNASFTHVFPQMADGRSGASSYVSIIWITNESSYAANCALTVHGIDSTRISGNTSFTVGVAGIVSRFTLGQQSLQTGYGRLDCTEPVTASLMYLQSGTKVQGMATVLSSTQPATYANFPMMIYPSLGYRYALALANDTDVKANIEVTLKLSNTLQIFGRSIQIPPRSHISEFVDELISAPLADGLGGILEVQGEADSTFHITALFFAGDVFTTVVPFSN